MRAFEFIDKQDSIKLLQGIFNKTLDAIASHPKNVRCLTGTNAKKAAVSKTQTPSNTKAKPKKNFKQKKPSNSTTSNTPATQTTAMPTITAQTSHLSPASQAKIASQPHKPVKPIKTSNRPLVYYLDVVNMLQNKQR